MRIYLQLTQEERYQIQALLHAGLSQNAIAKQLCRSQSSISREVARNKAGVSYTAPLAERHCRRRHASKPKRRKHWAKFDTWVHTLLQLGFTPERIAAESRQRKPFGETISHEWIYLRLREDARAGGQWWRYLPRARKKRTPRRAKAGQCGGIRNRVSIAERPDVVATRCRLGDWEVDTVVSAGKKTAVLTAVERKSRLYLVRHVSSRGADAVSKALIQLLKPYAAQGQVHTITSDNGREFAGHEKIASALRCHFYFADPYSSYQRGSNEHHNGLLRRFFPKGTDFARVSTKKLNAAIAMINIWPRRNLNWLCPMDMIKVHPIH